MEAAAMVENKVFIPREPRWRTRLRSGKVADRAGRFIIECQILNRSNGGALLRLVTSIEIPEKCLLFDDELATVRPIRTIWRKFRKVGVKYETIAADDTGEEPQKGADLAGKFYALNTVRDT
jgi:hypothetical protein